MLSDSGVLSALSEERLDGKLYSKHDCPKKAIIYSIYTVCRFVKRVFLLLEALEGDTEQARTGSNRLAHGRIA